MSKIILLLLLLCVSCTNDKEDEVLNNCDCVVLYQKKVNNGSWQSVGIGSEPSEIKDCSRNNEVVGTNDFSTSTQVVLYRRILNCK